MIAGVPVVHFRSGTPPRCASLVATALIVTACGGSPTVPASTGYAGLWSGTTAQGTPITFTISTEENVTTISIAHNFNGCSGSQTFSNLSLPIAPEIHCIPGPCSPSQMSYRQLTYSTGDRVNGPSFTIAGIFPSTSHAEGAMAFQNYPGCGSATGVPWSATRR
jgi:hypothetical protein